MSLTLLAIFMGILKAAIISPTSINDTIEYYINSQYYNTSNTSTYFATDTINCGSSTCHAICDVFEGCRASTINALSATTLIIECNNYRSCWDMIINADSTDNIHVKCNYNAASGQTTGSCYRFTLNAINSQSISFYCNAWNCILSNLYLTNAIISSFDIDGRQSFSSSNVFAENVTTPLNISCRGQSACSSVSFHVNNMISDLYLTCYGDSACGSLNLNGGTMNGNISIMCDGADLEDSCGYIKVNANDIAGILNMECMQRYSCSYMEIMCPEICNINCLRRHACAYTDIYIPSHWTNIVNLYCINDDAVCKDMYIKCNRIVDNVLRQYSGMKYTSSTQTWGCSGYGCCPTTIIDFRNITCAVGSDCVVSCPGYSTADGYRGCGSTYIDATMANSLSLDCGNNCRGTKIDCPIGVGTSCTIGCPGAYDCEYTLINASATHNFEIYCNGLFACRGAKIWSPYHAENVATINCTSSANQACYNLEVYVPDSYAYKYLDVQCESIQINGTIVDSTNSCNNLGVFCEDGNKQHIIYVYDHTVNDYVCQYNGDMYCCPYIISGSPTESPTGNTIYPTISPTKYPSVSPTEVTYSPTTSPSISTGIPNAAPTDTSMSPTYGPTISPSIHSSAPSIAPIGYTNSPTAFPTDISPAPTITVTTTTEIIDETFVNGVTIFVNPILNIAVAFAMTFVTFM